VDVLPVSEPELPPMVRRKPPVGVVVLVVTESVDEPPKAGLESKAAVAPSGSPITLRVTAPVNPPPRTILMV
jgi:hypothetical protein